MFISKTSIEIQVYEVIENDLLSGGKEHLDERLGQFAFLDIPNVGDLLTLKAFGSACFDGLPENVYVVERIMHHGCHLAWDYAAFQNREESKGPSVTVIVRFDHARERTENGWRSVPKGKLRLLENSQQKYSHKRIGEM